MIAVDHFAGCGWGVALKQRGIQEFGAENAPAALETRRINGMETYVEDVWDSLFGYPFPCPSHDLYLASPPCQTFSHAGAGAGRKALDQVLEAIDRDFYRWPDELQALGELFDPRTALVLAPLAHIWQHAPRLVALEQVEAVLPVWEAYATVMRVMGYSVWTGYLFAEQYGVAQTRKRAFLIARRDGIEARPPVPTHSRYHKRTPSRLDPGVKRWVTMADALGWGATERPATTITGGGGSRDGGTGSVQAMQRAQDAGDWKLRSNYGTSGDKDNRGERSADQPAATITSKANRSQWVFERPATTVVADLRMAGPGRSEYEKGGVSRQSRPGSLNLTPAEAALLQSFPPGFQFGGRTQNEVVLQIGNAVPPLLAGAIIDELMRTD